MCVCFDLPRPRLLPLRNPSKSVVGLAAFEQAHKNACPGFLNHFKNKIPWSTTQNSFITTSIHFTQANMTSFKTLAASFVALFFLSAIPTSFAYTDPFICMVNQARAAAGVGPVGFSAGLQQAAKRMASDMYTHNFVNHYGRWDGERRVARRREKLRNHLIICGPSDGCAFSVLLDFSLISVRLVHGRVFLPFSFTRF